MSSMCITKESDLYDRFDPSHTRLSNEAYRYLKGIYEELSSEERKNDVLRLQCEVRIDEEKAKESIRKAIGRDIVGYERQLSVNRVKMIRLYIIGIALVIVGIVMSLLLNQLVLEVVSIVGSMAVKDAATIQIQTNPELRIKKRLLERAKDMRIEVEYT